MDGYFGLFIGWRLGGHPLQPKTGTCEYSHQAALTFRSKANQLVAHAGNHGQQRYAGTKLEPEIVKGKKSIEDHGNNHDDHQKAGPAARVPGHKALRILNGYRLPRFEIKNYPVLGPVILEHAMDIPHPRQ